MGNLVATGFDEFINADEFWEYLGSGGLYGMGTAYGRNGTGGQEVQGTLGRNIGANLATAIVGASVYSAGVASNRIIFHLHEANSGYTHLQLRHMADGSVRFTNATGATIHGQTAPGIWGFPERRYVEIKCTISATVGTCECRLDEVVILSLTGLNNKDPGTPPSDVPPATFSQLRIGTGHYDDFYVNDTGGGVDNDYWGDVRMQTLLVGGAGSLAQLTPNGAAANWQCVDEAPPDGDTTYNAGSTAGLKDRFAFGNLLGVPTSIKTLWVNTRARKDDATTRSFAPAIIGSNGTAQNGATKLLSTGYVTDRQQFRLDPDTGLVWTPAGIDDAQTEVGYEIIA